MDRMTRSDPTEPCAVGTFGPPFRPRRHSADPGPAPILIVNRSRPDPGRQQSEGREMKILISAATKHGSTGDIASALGASLERRGCEVVVRPPDEVGHVAGYDAVVLGSGVYAGRWLGPAKRLIEREQDALAGIPVFLFSSGPLGEPPKPVEEPADVAALRARTSARDHRVFAGRLEKRRLGLAERAIVGAVRAPEGDYRPWAEIDAWAAEIAASLHAPA